MSNEHPPSEPVEGPPTDWPPPAPLATAGATAPPRGGRAGTALAVGASALVLGAGGAYAWHTFTHDGASPRESRTVTASNGAGASSSAGATAQPPSADAGRGGRMRPGAPAAGTATGGTTSGGTTAGGATRAPRSSSGGS